jgi:hypothetical protein
VYYRVGDFIPYFAYPPTFGGEKILCVYKFYLHDYTMNLQRSLSGLLFIAATIGGIIQIFVGMVQMLFTSISQFNFVLHAVQKLYQIKTTQGNPLKHNEKTDSSIYPIYFNFYEQIELFLMTSPLFCCFKPNLKLLKIFERGEKMVNKEFDVLQLFKSKKHKKIKKKVIDIDKESVEGSDTSLEEKPMELDKFNDSPKIQDEAIPNMLELIDINRQSEMLK